MMAFPSIDLEKIKGEFIGHGCDKTVWRHRLDPNLCLKISTKPCPSATIREIKNFDRLMKKPVKASFVPKFYGAFEGPDYVGFIQECFLDKEHGGGYEIAETLKSHILRPESKLSDVEQMLAELKAEIHQTGIIVSDMHGGNILYVVKDGCRRLVVIDGIGTPEFIPLPQYIPFLRRMKIERQWNKLMRRLKRFLDAKRQAEAK